MRELGEMLVDIHGQHEHQSLMKPSTQRQLLDDYANHKKPLSDLKTVFQQWHKIDSEYKQLKNAADERNDRIDLLRYQVQELDTLALLENEYPQLEEEHQRLANADRLMEISQQALQVIYDEEESNVYSQLSQQAAQIETLSETDHKLLPAKNMLNEAMIQIEETASHLRDYLSQLENDPQRLEELDNRIALIHDLSRKHHVKPKQLTEIHQQLSDELNRLDHADENLIELEKQSQQLEQKILNLAQKLSQSRKKKARELNKKITAAMQTLGMQGGCV